MNIAPLKTLLPKPVKIVKVGQEGTDKEKGKNLDIRI